MGKIGVLTGLLLALCLGCSSFDDNYEPNWGDDDCASGDDDVVGDDDHVDDDDSVGDDDDASSGPQIRVDPIQIMMQVEVLSAGTHDLRIFNDGGAELIITGMTQLIGTSGVGIYTWSGPIGVGAYHDLVPAVEADCHTNGLLQETLQIEHNDMLDNPTQVNIIIDCFEP